MKMFFFFILIIFLLGCTEEEWNEIICYDKDNPIALKIICWFQSPVKTHRYVIDINKCPGEGSYYDQVTETCLTCENHAQFNGNSGKCTCVGGYIRDVDRGCIKQAECYEDKDCVGKVSFGDTCSDSMTRLKPICFQQNCKTDYEHCEYGCNFKNGKCRKWTDVPCVNIDDCRKYGLYDTCETHKDIDSGTLYHQRHFWKCITSFGLDGHCGLALHTCASLADCETGKCL